MSVLEHVMVGYHSRMKTGVLEAWVGSRRLKREEMTAREKASQALRVTGLEGSATKLATALSAPEQRALELAQALVVEPRLIILDEPAAGLSTQERKTLVELILTIRQQGKAILLVEHDMGVVMPVSDEVVVLNFGKIIAQGTGIQIQQDRNVVVAYLGGD
jgi:branched-chain amino acid transport system ATP-binding protein